MKNNRVFGISLISIMAALVIASYIFKDFLPRMVQGGTIELQYIAIALCSIILVGIFGKRKGIVMSYSLIAVVISLLLPLNRFEALGFVNDIWEVLLVFVLDYFVPYILAGSIALLFTKNSKLLILSIIIVFALIFISHFLVGIIIWKIYAPEGQTALVYSFLYNGWYMLLTTIVALILIPILTRRLNPTINNLAQKN